MGIIIPMSDHTRPSIGSGLKKASIGTTPPETSLKRLASPREASLRPAKMLRKCATEQLADSASCRTVIPLDSAQRSIRCCSDIMMTNIPPRNVKSQQEKFPSEIAIPIKDLLECDMAKKRDDETPAIYLGDWLKHLGIKVGEAAAIAGCDQPYISNICAGRKSNVNVLYLLRLSEHMGVNINDFYHPLPDKSELAAFKKLSPRAQATLLARIQKKG